MVFGSIVILMALAALVFTIRIMTEENRRVLESQDVMMRALSADLKESAEREQLAYMNAAAQVRGIITDAFDRLQSKTAAEAADVAHVRAQSSVAIRNLQDELAKVKVKPPSQTKIKDALGNEYNRDEIEIA